MHIYSLEKIFELHDSNNFQLEHFKEILINENINKHKAKELLDIMDDFSKKLQYSDKIDKSICEMVWRLALANSLFHMFKINIDKKYFLKDATIDEEITQKTKKWYCTIKEKIPKYIYINEQKQNVILTKTMRYLLLYLSKINIKDREKYTFIIKTLKSINYS